MSDLVIDNSGVEIKSQFENVQCYSIYKVANFVIVICCPDAVFA